MKSFLVGSGLAALAALVGVPAEAQDAPANAPLTRAEVRAELLRARAAGELDFTLMPVLREDAAPRATRSAAAEPRDAAPRERRPDAPAAEAARLAASR